MKKKLEKFITVILISLVMTCLSIIYIYGAFSKVLTKNNIQKALCNLDISSLMNGDSNGVTDLVDQYTNNTSFSKNEVDKIINSSEYSSIVGNYMMDENMLDITSMAGLEDIKELEDLGNTENVDELFKNDNINNISAKNINKKEIKELFEDIGVEYTDRDISYVENSIINKVVHDIQKNIEGTQVKSIALFGNLNFEIFEGMFSNKIFNISKIVLVFSMIGILLLNISWLRFLWIYAICSGVTFITAKSLYSMTTNLDKILPSQYLKTIEVFVSPLKESFKKTYIIMLVCTLVFIALNILLRLTYTQTSIGDSISFMNRIYKTKDDKIEIRNNARFSVNDCSVNAFDTIGNEDDKFIIDDFAKDLNKYNKSKID